MSRTTEPGPHAARSRRRAAQGSKRHSGLGEGLHRPRPVRRPRLAARRGRARHHLDGVQTLNPVFLSPRNLVNMLFDCSTVGVISLGIVCVLMVGEIDLSVGSVSGLSSAILGVLWVQHRAGRSASRSSRRSSAGCLIGCMYALLFNRLGMPSFVSTLSGLLAFLGPAALHPRARQARSTCPMARRW